MDTSSEEWRHICEARTCLRMPLLSRQAHLQGVEKKRGEGERRRLENSIFRLWVEGRVDKLMEIQRDDYRAAFLLQLEQATNSRNRATVEAALKRRMEAANDNKPADLFGTN